MASSATTITRSRAHNVSQQDTLTIAPPALLAFNRRLRNLKSISLRNLNVEAATPGRPRGHTIDDDADPHAYASPTKLRALREEHVLEHSHSSIDLRRESALGEKPDLNALAVDHGSPKAKTKMNGGSVRKRPGRLRRRSTLDWTNASAVRRQEKLEQVKQDRMANVFYSLYVEGVQEPVYISETAHQTMDPTFRSIDLSLCCAGVLRQSAIKVRFWTQSLSTFKWSLLREWHVRLETLRFLGPKNDHTSVAFEKNTLLFQFDDGMYTLPATFPHSLKQIATHSQTTSRNRQVEKNTSSFDALLKLSKLTESIEDALATRNKLAKQLDEILSTSRTALDQRDHVTEHHDRCKTVVYARDMVTKQISKASKQIEEKRANLQRRRTLLEDDLKQRERALNDMREGRGELPYLREDRQIRNGAMSAQQRRVVEDLSKIYPINSVGGGKTFAFNIRGLRLPDAEELDSVPGSEAAASLGFVVHATQLLSFYLGRPVPYHLHFMGSTSWVTDPISLISGTTGAASTIANALSRTEDKVYPLHQSRVARFRFDYGVFLLNKDIQLLLESAYGVRVLDIRHTLPNLKYLFYVATAGEGELPSRKAGGIRGLIKQSPRGSPSRSNSPSVPGWINIVTGKEEKKEVKNAAQSLRQLVQD